MPFFGGTITKRRLASGSIDATGGYVNGASTDTTIRADVQGYINEEDMKHLPEGTRVQDVKVLYVDAGVLRTVDQDASPPLQADRVLIDGYWYQVMAIRQHRNLLLHQKALVVRGLIS